MTVNAIDQERVTERRAFVQSYIGEFQPRHRARMEASWSLMTTGSEMARDELGEASQALELMHADASTYEQLSRWVKEDPTGDSELDRQIEVLQHAFGHRQGPPELLARIVELQTELSHTFGTHRGEVDGAPMSDSEIERVLSESDDVELRRKAWEASKSVGATVADRVRELARLRNELAVGQGYRDYYAMSLARQELDEDELFRTLDTLERATRAPFRTRKAVYDAERARRFETRAEELRPWHYTNPFFQSVEVPDALPLDETFADLDLEDVTARFYDGLGMNVRDVLARSDLYPREGKNQHAFCMDVDRAGDIRVLANVRPSERWMSTMLHEFGHAVYDRYLDRNLPYVLRRPAHTFVTESIAMLMDRQTNNVEFLIEYAGLPAMEVTPLSGELRRNACFRMQVFVRWVLVIVNFERALYEDPDREDLNAHWWSLVRRYQLIEPPEGREEHPDWAAKLHLALAPVYYQNYMLGELLASQLHAHISTQSRHPALADNQYAGEFLIQQIFQPGASLRWDALVERATGQELSPDAFIKEFT